MTARRRIIRLTLALISGVLLAGAGTTSAHAEDGYRFWGYHQWAGGAWTFASSGPDTVVPADGSTEGWRFAVGGNKPRVPRAAGDFQAICGKVTAEPGKKRVAVVVDPGTPEDAPTGQPPASPSGTCVVADTAATGAKVLAAVAPIRIEKGLTCAIDGYPAKGCGEPVKNIKVPPSEAPVDLQTGAVVGAAATPTLGSTESPNAQPDDDQDADADDGSQPWLVLILPVALLVVALGVGAIALSRRRRRGDQD